MIAIIGTSDQPCWLAEACKIFLLLSFLGVWRRVTSTVPSVKHRPSCFFGALLPNALTIWFFSLCIVFCLLAPVGPQGIKT